MAGIYSTVLSGHEVLRGDFWQIVWHWFLEESGINSAYQFAKNLINELWDTINAAFSALVPDTVLIDNITGKKVTGDGGPTAIRGINANGVAGSMTGGTLNEGARIAWFMVDESHVGATIIPGIPGSSFVDEKFVAAYVTSVEEFADLMTTELTIGGGGGAANFMVQNKDNPTEPQLVMAGEIRERPSAIGRRTLRW